MRTARVRVFCPLGLSAQDEFYLWGLLALTLRESEPAPEFHATPHFCLRQFGVIDANHRRGGRQYQRFRDAIDRLSVVRYLNDRFYDPVRAEHRQVSFGFFSYSLPTDAESGRAWRFYWDPLFFEFARAAGGALRFDLELYRRLDPASRRLFLLISKVFPRRDHISFDLRQLAVDVLGLSRTLIPRDQLAKTRRCLRKLASQGVIQRPDAGTISKLPTNQYRVAIRASGDSRQTKPAPSASSGIASPLAELLGRIGVDGQSVGWMLKTFPHCVLREWIDITLAARERFGDGFFKRSPAAYFVDNVKQAVTGQRTPPDWWHEVRRAEESRRSEQLRRSLADKRFAVRAGNSRSDTNGLTPIADVLARLPMKSV